MMKSITFLFKGQNFFSAILNTAVFTGFCRRRRKQNRTVSLSPRLSTQNFKELKVNGLALPLKRKVYTQLLWPSFLASQEMGVEQELKTLTVIKPNPAK